MRIIRSSIAYLWCFSGIRARTLEIPMYISPVYDIAQKHGIEMHQYADDIRLYLAFDLDRQQEAMARMEACVEDIKIWMRHNKLQLNEDKTELLIITPSRQVHQASINAIKIKSCEVQAILWPKT